MKTQNFKFTIIFPRKTCFQNHQLRFQLKQMKMKLSRYNKDKIISSLKVKFHLKIFATKYIRTKQSVPPQKLISVAISATVLRFYGVVVLRRSALR